MKVIDFPRNKRILESGKFQPAPYGVINKMIYCENAGGYWSNDTLLMDDRLHELGLLDAFVKKLHEFESAEIKQSFEFVSRATGEIFALVEKMECDGGRFYLNYYAFTDLLAFSCMTVELYALRLPNARADYESGALFDLDATEAGACNDQ